MLMASVHRLEDEIRASEREVVECDRRAGASFAGLRAAATRAVAVKLAAGAGLLAAGWLMRRPSRHAEPGGAPHRRRRLPRGLPFRHLMPFLLPVLAPLIDRKVALMLGALGLPIVARTLDPLRTVPALDLDRFSGGWFEIARLPQRGDAPGLHDVTIQYARDGERSLKVTSRCLDDAGELHEAIGRARMPHPKFPGELELTFAPPPWRWWPGVWKDHWVLYADAEYTCALIGSPERDRLRVLARQTSMPQDAVQALLALAAKQGFDTTRVQRTPHA